MRAVTWIDSGLPLGSFPPSNMESLPTMAGFRLLDSGEESVEPGGGADGPLVSELALSATDGERDGSRPLGFRTEKKLEAGRSFPEPSPPPALLDSFSKALMRWEMLDPILLLVGRNSADEFCCVILCRNAAPVETLLAELVETSPGVRMGPRIGFDTVLTMRGVDNEDKPLSTAVEGRRRFGSDGSDGDN